MKTQDFQTGPFIFQHEWAGTYGLLPQKVPVVSVCETFYFFIPLNPRNWFPAEDTEGDSSPRNINAYSEAALKYPWDFDQDSKAWQLSGYIAGSKNPNIKDSSSTAEKYQTGSHMVQSSVLMYSLVQMIKKCVG